MPNLADSDKLLFTMWSEVGGQTILNTQILQYTTGLAGPEDYAAFANAYLTDADAIGGLVDQLIPYLSDQYTVKRLTLQKVYPTRLAAQIVISNQVGTLTGVPAPVNSACVVTKKSMSATRYGIGSWHQTGLPVGAVMAGGADWTNAFYPNIASALDTWFIPARVPTGKSGRLEAILWNANTPLRITPITQYTGNSSIRTMHRRTKGIGI